MIVEKKRFETRAFAASTGYDSEFSGYPVESVQFTFMGTLSGAAANVANDAAFRMLGTELEIVQDTRALVRMEGGTARHFSAAQNGTYDQHTAATGTGVVVAHGAFHFDRLYPGCMIDASSGGSKARMRGKFAALADYSGTAPTALSANLRPRAYRAQGDPRAGYFRPYVRNLNVPLETADSDKSHVIPFDQDQIILGLMIEAHDASGGNVGGANVDGLIREMRVNANVSGYVPNMEIERARWSHLRNATAQELGYNTTDITQSIGVVFIPISDPLGVTEKGLLVRKGDSITLHFDTLKTVEDGYTAVTPASGDKAKVLIVAVEAVAPVVGDPNAGVRTNISTPELQRRPQALVRNRRR